MFHSRSILFDSGWRGAFLRHHLTEQGAGDGKSEHCGGGKIRLLHVSLIGKTQFINGLWNFKYRVTLMFFFYNNTKFFFPLKIKTALLLPLILKTNILW